MLFVMREEFHCEHAHKRWCEAKKKNQLRQSIHAKRNSGGCCANLIVLMSHVTFTGSIYVGLFNLTIIDQNLSMFEQWLFGAWETLIHSFIPNKAVISAELCPLFSSCASAPCITSLFSLYLFLPATAVVNIYHGTIQRGNKHDE